jgi:hypothetical protein
MSSVFVPPQSRTRLINETQLSPLGQQFVRFCNLHLDDEFNLCQSFIDRRLLSAELYAHVLLLERREDHDFVIIIAGSVVCDSYGRDMHDMLLSEVFTGENSRDTVLLLNQVLESGLRSVSTVGYHSPEGEVVYERIIQPVADLAGIIRWNVVFLNRLSGVPARILLNPQPVTDDVSH